MLNTIESLNFMGRQGEQYWTTKHHAYSLLPPEVSLFSSYTPNF